MGFWRKFKKTPGQVAFHDDIVIKSHELRPRYTDWQYNVLLKFIVPQIRMAIKNPNQHTIKFGTFGRFHFRPAYARRKMDFFRKYIDRTPTATRRFRERVQLVEEQIQIFDKKLVEAKKDAKQYVNSIHLRSRFFTIRIYGRRMNLEQLENYMKNIDDARRQAD